MPQESQDLFSQQAPSKDLRRIYTVSEINQDIKLILENTFSSIWVEGEVSGVSRIATGTVFFSLKDKSSLLRCVMFASFVLSSRFEIKDGMQLICFGKIGVYEKDGKYQLYAQQIEPKGLGSLQLALEQLKDKLQKEGLFKAEHKRQIPYLPSRVGIVTSPTGAAIKDILKVLDRRFRDIHIIISPARVQGEGAKEEIAQAIRDLNDYNARLPKGQRIEVMIVGRGGGSIEDLWAFNEEVVCRAIYDSAIPVISAVGHERDVTISDLVADLRAATPSVAAELIIPRKEDLKEKLNSLVRVLRQWFFNLVDNFQEELDNLAHRSALSMGHILRLNFNRLSATTKKLYLLNPRTLIQQREQRNLDLARQIQVNMQHSFKIKQMELAKAAQNLSGLSPLNILSRGYSITFSADSGLIIKDARGVRQGDTLSTRLRNGRIVSKVTQVKLDGI